MRANDREKGEEQETMEKSSYRRQRGARPPTPKRSPTKSSIALCLTSRSPKTMEVGLRLSFFFLFSFFFFLALFECVSKHDYGLLGF